MEANLPNSLFAKFFWPASTAREVLSKDPILWLDRSRLANTFISPSLQGNMPAQLCRISTHPKIRLQVLKIGKYNNRERVWQTHFWQQWFHQLWNLTFPLFLYTRTLLFINCVYIFDNRPWTSATSCWPSQKTLPRKSPRKRSQHPMVRRSPRRKSPRRRSPRRRSRRRINKLMAKKRR